MSKQWAKQELHKNELAEAAGTAVSWVEAHREAALGIFLTVAIAGLLGLYAWVKTQDVKKSAWERLAIAQSHAFAGQTDQALEQLRVLADQYGRTPAAPFGELFQGDILFRTGRYKESVEAYRRVLERGEAKLEAFALAGIASAQEAAGEPASASETAARFLDTYQDHFLAPQLQQILARSLTAQGKAQEARKVLENVTLLYPDTVWAQAAQRALNPTPASGK